MTNKWAIFSFMNLAAPIYCIIMQVVVGSVTYFMCIPTIYRNDDQTQFWHRACFLIFFIGLVVNYILCFVTRSTLKRNQVIQPTKRDDSSATVLPMYSSESMKEWTYCTLCRLDSPPRCYHCPICNECVLKRISHCFFVGRCIGHFNHRYYISFLIYTVIVAFYSLILYLNYLHDDFGSPFSLNIISFLYPIALGQFFLGKTPLDSLLLLTLTYQCLMYTVGCTFLFFQAWFQLTNGQTPHETHNKISIYKYTMKENIQIVFGRKWLLALILPWPTALPKDGITWEVSNFTKNL